MMVLGMIVVFQIPTLIFFLARMRMVTARFLWRNLKYAVLVSVIAAAVLTPSADPWNQFIYAAPMIALYLIGIVIAWVVGPERADTTHLRLVVAAAVAEEAGEAGQQLEPDVAKLGPVDDVERLAEQLLGLVVAALRAPHDRERHPGRRTRALVVRPDGLARLERVPLRLVELPLRGEQLREPALALAERSAVLQRLEDADRVGFQPLGARELALPPRDPRERVVLRSDAPGGTRLLVQRPRLLERRLRLVEQAADREQPAA